MSSNKLVFRFTNIIIHASVAVCMCLHLSGCATDEVKADDENSTAMAADFDKQPGDAPPADADVNPDLAKDTLSESGSDSGKVDDLGIDDSAPPAAATTNPKLDTPVTDPQKLTEGDISATAAAKNDKVAVPEVTAVPTNPFSQDVEITNVKYNSEKNGGTLSIETSAPATFRKREGTNPSQIVIEVANAKIPARLLRPLVTKDFRQSIASVYVYQDKASGTARFVVQMRDKSAANVKQDGKTILVASQSISDDSKTEAEGQDQSGVGGEGGFKTFSTKGPVDPKKQQASDDTLKYYGKPINIEVRDTPVIDVLNFISEQSGANLLINNEVKGQITLKLKQIPWDQALLLVMKSQQLGYVREGSVLRIAPLDSLKAESDKAAKVLESQHDAEPLKVKIIPVSYAKVEELTTQLASFLSKRGKVVADKRTSSVVITDIVENLERASNLVKALDTPPFQVLIEGKVIEAGQNFTSNIGIQWGLTGGQLTSGAQTLSPNLNITPSSALGTQGASLGLTYGTFDALGSLNAQLQLFESEQLIRVVSSPRVVTVNNETANISQTVNIPVQTTTITAGSAPVITYTFQPIELALKVTPQITAESDVIMQIDLKREFQANVALGAAPPSINKRQAQTKVMVRNGQTAVIGGIYQSDNTVDESGVPYLRSLPVVGWLFKNKARQETKNELLLFLTPRILNSEQMAKTGEAL